MTSGLQHKVVKFQNKYPHLPIYGSETFSERRFLTNVCKPKLCFFYITTDSPQSIQLIDQHLGRLLFTFNRQGLTPVAHNHPHYLKKTTTAQRRKLTLLFSHQSALAIAASQFNERYFRKQNKKSTFFSKSAKMSKIEKKC